MAKNELENQKQCLLVFILVLSLRLLKNHNANINIDFKALGIPKYKTLQKNALITTPNELQSEPFRSN